MSVSYLREALNPREPFKVDFILRNVRTPRDSACPSLVVLYLNSSDLCL